MLTLFYVGRIEKEGPYVLNSAQLEQPHSYDCTHTYFLYAKKSPKLFIQGHRESLRQNKEQTCAPPNF